MKEKNKKNYRHKKEFYFINPYTNKEINITLFHGLEIISITTTNESNFLFFEYVNIILIKLEKYQNTNTRKNIINYKMQFNFI